MNRRQALWTAFCGVMARWFGKQTLPPIDDVPLLGSRRSETHRNRTFVLGPGDIMGDCVLDNCRIRFKHGTRKDIPALVTGCRFIVRSDVSPTIIVNQPYVCVTGNCFDWQGERLQARNDLGRDFVKIAPVLMYG